MNFLNKIKFPKAALAIFLSALPLLLSGCFTGVESTKKITLSRDDLRLTSLTREDTFLNAVKSEPLIHWKAGKEFVVSDSRLGLLFETGTDWSGDTTGLANTTLRFKGISSRRRPDGMEESVILFNNGGRILSLPSGKTTGAATEAIRSDQLPMLIDADMVAQARRLLLGKKLWIKTTLWYDAASNRIPNSPKFIPVTVTDVKSGTLVFPLKVFFTDEKGTEACVWINFGHSGSDSRSFASIFSLDDIRRRYPHITDEDWKLIVNGRLREGMTKEECRLSLGAPSHTDTGHNYSSTLDVWQYDDGTFLRFQDGLLFDFRKLNL